MAISTSWRSGAAAVILAACVVSAACSSSPDPSSLPPSGTGAPNSPPGSFPDANPLVPSATLPSSGDPASCPAAPFQLEVRTASGETRTVTAATAWALRPVGASSWLFVASDLELSADALGNGLPAPGDKTVVVIRLVNPQPTTTPIPLAAGDRFAGVRTEGAPPTAPVVELQVRDGEAIGLQTEQLSGSISVTAVTPTSICLDVDLDRANGAKAKGRIDATIVTANPSVLSS